MDSFKCVMCEEDCEVDHEYIDYSATHCAPTGGIWKSSYYVSKCCGAEYEEIDNDDN